MMRSGNSIHLRAVLAVALLGSMTLNGRAEPGQLEKVEFDEASLEEIIQFFRTGGGTRAEPRNILVDPGLDREIKVTLLLLNVSEGEAFAYVAELAGFDYREERHALRVFPLKEGKEAAREFLRRGGARTWQRASEMRMPKVEFDSTTLREVVTDLSAASRRLDPKNAGLNIILGRGVDPATPVTLQLQDVPIATVLKYVAQLARLQVRADGPAVVLMARPTRETPLAP